MPKSIIFLIAFVVSLLSVSAAQAMSPEDAKIVANSAERGNDGAQVLLAVIYLNGDAGYAKNEKLAAHWFEQAAEQGNAYAQEMLGDLYASGSGVPASHRLARDWWEKAATRGNVLASLKLGKLYLTGAEGVPKDLDKAEYWLNRAAVEGNGEAQFLLGKLYHSRNGDKRNRELADNWLAKSAAQGYQDAISFLHFMQQIGLEVKETFHHHPADLHKLAQDGDAEAQYQLAVRYENGAYGEKQDYAKALYWFRQSANGGNAMAMRSLAHIYEKGLDGVAADPGAARGWMEKAKSAAK